MSEENKYDLDFRKQGGRYHCMNCGFISVHELDLETKYLDLHCKCGAPVIRVSQGIDEYTLDKVREAFKTDHQYAAESIDFWMSKGMGIADIATQLETSIEAVVDMWGTLERKV